jgi:hypothetical protein
VAQLCGVFLEVGALERGRPVAPDDEQTKSRRQKLLGVLETADEAVPQIRVVAVRVLLAVIDEELTGCPGVDQALTAVLDRDGGDAGVGHQHDLQRSLLWSEPAGCTDGLGYASGRRGGCAVRAGSLRCDALRSWGGRAQGADRGEGEA